MSDLVIEKFMEGMGIVYSINRVESFNSKNYCNKVVAKHNDNDEYVKYFCWRMTHRGVEFSEGNNVVSVNEGIFAYLGDKIMVDKYFYLKAKEQAIKYFEENGHL